ncbi:MAG TPA: cytochrome P450, partial [Polyangiales bacterium]
FRGLVKERRGKQGNDLFSELCHAQSDRGERFSDDSIVDHMIFLMMAAHDTTTSTLTSIVHCLIAYPEWQERIRAEIHARGDAPLSWDEREALPTLDRVFDETLRLFPPVPFITRRNLRPWKVGDVEVPANTALMISSLVTHRLPQYWKDPARFDPDRFLPERAEHAVHSHAYYPFGGGSHICLGMHFARFQVKAVLNELLFRHRILSDGPIPKDRFVSVPIPRPRDNLPVVLEAL